MDVTLGVSLEPAVARVALLTASPPNTLIDSHEVDLSTGALEELLDTVVTTDRALTESGHRLLGTTICGPDDNQTAALLNALSGTSLHNVAVVSAKEAVTEATRALAGDRPVAAMANDGSTATLELVAAGGTSQLATTPIVNGDAASAYRTLLSQLDTDDAPTSVIVLGWPDQSGVPADLVQTSPVPLHFADGAAFALARGAALAGARQGSADVQLAASDSTMAAPVYGSAPADSTMAAPAYQAAADSTMAAPLYQAPTDSTPGTTAAPVEQANTAMGEQLAWSEPPEGSSGYGTEADTDYGLDYGNADYETVPAEYGDEYDEYGEGDEEDQATRRRQLLIGSSVASLAIVGFATLAVSVAVTVQPTASEQAMAIQEAAVPGNAFPVAPGQGAQPDGDNWTMVEKLPAPNTTAPTVRTFQPVKLGAAKSSVAQPAINVYRDGTMGLANTATNIPVETPPWTGPGDPPPGYYPPVVDQLVSRLIPDFTKVTPIEALNFFAALTQQILNPLSNPVVPFDAAIEPGQQAFKSLQDVGVLAVVDKNMGAIFEPTKNLVKTPDAGLAENVIPTKLFDQNLSVTDKASLVPKQASVIDTALLTKDVKAGDPSLLDQVLLDPQKLAKTGVVYQGTDAAAKVETLPPITTSTDSNNTNKTTTDDGTSTGVSTPGVSTPGSTSGSTPGSTPSDKSTPSSTDQSSVVSPSGTPGSTKSSVDGSSSASQPTPSAVQPTPSALQPTPSALQPTPSALQPTPSAVRPTPSAGPIPTPTAAPIPTPTAAPIPTPVQQAPIPTPVQQAPIPTPVQQAPPVVQAPVQEAPVVQAPVQQAPPVVQAPVQEAPVVQEPVPSTASEPAFKLPGLFG